jgi:hypothetical protein
MPLYEFEERATGKRLELFRTIRDRDCCPPNLRRVMARPSCRIGKGAQDPTVADQAVPRALQSLEQTMPTSELERQTGFSTKELKRIWKIK